MTAEHGGGMPHTRRGLAMAYGPVPWQMITRTLAVWYRLADPAEAQRHSHPSLQVEPDPVVRARFWDIRHDAGRAEPGDYIELREAAIGFPVRFDGEQGDDTVYMFATDPVYTAFGREMMGWPVVGGDVSVDPATLSGRNVLSSWITPKAPEGQYWTEPRSGDRFSGALTVRGHRLMHMTVELSARVESEEAQRPGPRWITHRFLPDITGASTVDQIIQTAPTRVAWGSIWRATGQLEFFAAPGSELHYLAPREIVAAEYWCNLRLELGSGRILAGTHQ